MSALKVNLSEMVLEQEFELLLAEELRSLASGLKRWDLVGLDSASVNRLIAGRDHD